jgi:hypothetical protein
MSLPATMPEVLVQGVHFLSGLVGVALDPILIEVGVFLLEDSAGEDGVLSPLLYHLKLVATTCTII